jgi:hypothetical protein
MSNHLAMYSPHVLQHLHDVLEVIRPSVIQNPQCIVSLVDLRSIRDVWRAWARAVAAAILQLDTPVVVVELVEDHREPVDLGLCSLLVSWLVMRRATYLPLRVHLC